MSDEDAGTLPADNAPVVTAQTRWRKGGFTPASEIPDTPHAGELPVESAPAEEVLTDDEGIVEMTAAGEEPAAPEETPAAEPAKFKIGTKEFTKQEEAWAYAEELEQERLAADAFRQGVEAGTKLNPGLPAPALAAPPEPAEIDPEYYTNPKAYFAKREAQIVAKAQAAVEQASAQRTRHENTWTNFYKEYPDLVGAERIVRTNLDDNWARLQHVETKQALKELAEKARAEIKTYKDAWLPKVPLAKVGQVASPGGAQQVTRPAAAQPVLNFVQTMRKLKGTKRRAK